MDAITRTGYRCIKEAARQVPYSEAHIRRLCENGRIPCFFHGSWWVDVLALKNKTHLNADPETLEQVKATREAIENMLSQEVQA
jgi:hypothetical protein